MRKKLPPLTALRSFEAAARHGSFRHAAEELCVSHSAVSHQIKLLEENLGVALFVRKSRSVELSKLGSIYYPILRDAFDLIAQGAERLRSPQSSAVLTVQLYSTFAIRWLIPRLSSFYKNYPGVQVRLNTSQKDVDFEQEDVDLCVMIGQRVSEKLHYDYLFSSELFPVASPSLIAGKTPLKRIEDLRRHTVLQVYPSKKDWHMWLDSVNLADIDLDAGLQFDSYDHALSTATQGLGVALGMQPYVSRDISAGLLVELFPGQRTNAAGEWYLVCRRERADNKNIAIFRRWLLDAINDDASLQ
ncbi:MAG: LysR family glycine cleavage system transcriptional activator [Gammaproteobacteria bacterium]|jgi:LysR family glycine cleavage system transcriptional activator